MRSYALALSMVVLSGSAFGLNSASELQSYADAHDMFRLRDALKGERRPTDFFVAQVACAFNDTTACEDKFKKILATRIDPTTAKQIHHILAAVALRQGGINALSRSLMLC